jgi:hypothetical protein
MTWALPLYLLRGNFSFEPLRRLLARPLMQEGRPAPADLSELQAAGWLKLLEADLTCVPGSSARSADLVARWAVTG